MSEWLNEQVNAQAHGWKRKEDERPANPRGNTMINESETQATAERGDLVTLARVLQEARLARHWSLRAAARAAGLNPMLLSRLERGELKTPSPHALYQIGHALNLPYADLMRLSGYAAPVASRSADEEATTTMDDALGAEGLLLRSAAPFTEDELDAMLAFLCYYRQRNGAHIQARTDSERTRRNSYEERDHRQDSSAVPVSPHPPRKRASRESARQIDNAS